MENINSKSSFEILILPFNLKFPTKNKMNKFRKGKLKRIEFKGLIDFSKTLQSR